jgi:hypothetical protein
MRGRRQREARQQRRAECHESATHGSVPFGFRA